MYVKKKIEIEAEFDENFIPPENFDERKCESCPFYYYEKEECRGWCTIGFDDWKHTKCPIKKYF